MNKNETSQLPDILRKYERELLADWVEQQLMAVTLRRDLMKETELQEQSREFLSLFREAIQNGNLSDITGPTWAAVREFLGSISRSRSQQGFSPSETAAFVFSLKQPLFERLRQEYSRNAEGLGSEIWTATLLLDKLGCIPQKPSKRTVKRSSGVSSKSSSNSRHQL